VGAPVDQAAVSRFANFSLPRRRMQSAAAGSIIHKWKIELRIE
jgi:hypothetical protein